MSSSGSFYSIQTFNPYEAAHPGHKVVDGELLTLIKLLRDQGNTVVIEPDDGRPIEYLFRKGVKEFLSDPAVINFGLNVAAGLVGAAIAEAVKWVWQHRRRESIVRSAPQPTNILLRNKETGLVFSYSGEPLDEKALDRLLKMAERERSTFREAFLLRSPSADKPVPLFLEHTARVVGWCDMDLDDEGFYVKDGAIQDRPTWRKVESGELKGLGITGIAIRSTCSVCRRSYVECNHISGVNYDSVNCTNEIEEAVFINVNLVSSPINQRCYLQMIQSARNNE
jgi:hypothetical protein